MTTGVLSLEKRVPPYRLDLAEPALVRLGLIVVSLAFLGLFLFVPLAAILFEALKHGLGTYLASFQEPDAIAAIQLTLLAAAIAVPAECRLRHFGRMGHCQIRVLGQAGLDHA